MGGQFLAARTAHHARPGTAFQHAAAAQFQRLAQEAGIGRGNHGAVQPGERHVRGPGHGAHRLGHGWKGRADAGLRGGEQLTHGGVGPQGFGGGQCPAALGPFERRGGLGEGDGHHGDEDSEDNQQLQDQVLPGKGHSSSSSHCGSFC